MTDAANAANWESQNYAVRLLSQLSTHEDFTSLGLDAGITLEDLSNIISKSGMTSLSMLTSDRDASKLFFEKSSDLMEAISGEQQDVVTSIVSNKNDLSVQPNSLIIKTSLAAAEDPADVTPNVASNSVALSYFNRYQQVVKGIVDEGTLEFDDQTIADMKAYGTDEPAIIYAGTMAGQDFYGFMTSPESYDLVKQGIMENVSLADQTRQLEILDLLKIDADRMARDFPRAMDGPIADAQGEHLAFASTVNPEQADEVLADVGTNHEIAQRVASNIVMSMPEIKLVENFTAAVDVDPTIPKNDLSVSPSASAPLLSSFNADSAPVIDTTTPPAPEKVVLASTTKSLDPVVDLSTIADIGDLMNGKAGDDTAYLKRLEQEAEKAGVDPKVVADFKALIHTDDGQTKFVTSANAALTAIQVHKELEAGLADGTLNKEEYAGALTGMIKSISDGGIVVDRKGKADDIAAAPGMEVHAKESIRRIFDMQAEGLVAANLTTRPMPRPEGLVAGLG